MTLTPTGEYVHRREIGKKRKMQRPNEIVLRSRRPLSSTEKQKVEVSVNESGRRERLTRERARAGFASGKTEGNR
jgi:hypothetical protein